MPRQQARRSIYHVRIFCYWIDGKDQNKIDFLFLGTIIVAKSK